MLFKKHTEKKSYDPTTHRPVIKCSICTGEQVAGFEDIRNRTFEDVMLIQNETDLNTFRNMYGIEGSVEKIY